MEAIYRTLCFPPADDGYFLAFVFIALLLLGVLVLVALVLATMRWPDKPHDEGDEVAPLKHEKRCKHRRVGPRRPGLHGVPKRRD